MTTLFPSSLDNFTNPHGSLSGGSDKLSTPGVIHGVQHQNINDAMAAVETKLGIDNSVISTSIDYLLKNVLSVDPGHKHTAASITGVGTVTSISVASANGFAGSVANPTTTPAITLSTTITGLLKGNGTAISSAIVGTDYVTDSSTNTFTNKSGNISQWTNNSGYLTGNQTITLSGDVSGSGATSITTAIGAGKVTNTMLAGSITASKLVGTDITSVGTITTGTWSGLFGAVSGANLTNLTASNISAGTAGINITGNAATVTTNANLTGVITSVGNATSIASQTGTGTKFVVDTSPTLVTPNIGVATGTSLQAIIGNVTPAAGTFTDLTSNGNTTIGDASTDTVTHNAAVITVPTALVYTKTAQVGVAEVLFTYKVSDSLSSFSFVNATSNVSEFSPNFTSVIEAGFASSALVFSGTLGTTTTANGATVFLGRANAGAGNVDLTATQNISVFRNRATDAFYMSGGYNFIYAGGGTSPTLNAGAIDLVATAGFDRVNTRHTAAGNRLLAIQSEKGAAIYVGDDALDFAAATAYISVNGTDTVTLIAGQMGLGVTPGAVIDLLGSTTSVASLRIRSGTAPTSPNNGDVWNDATQNMIAFYNGNTLYQSGNLYTATSGVTINTTTPTTSFSSTKIGTTTIKANTLKIGQKFIIWGSGYYSTPLANTATVTITVKIGSVTVSTVTTAAFPASATNLPFDFLLQFTVQAIGSGTSAKVVCDGSFNYATALSAVAKTSNSLSSIGQIGFDSTADQAMDILASWSAVTTQTATIQQSKIDFL